MEIGSADAGAPGGRPLDANTNRADEETTSTIARPFRWAWIFPIAVAAAVCWTHPSRSLAGEKPQVQAKCGDAPIKRFGFCRVLGEAPSLVDDAPLQAGNAAPRVKIHPKDGSQIKRDYLGVTTTRMPRSTDNDYLPLEAIHLIDGDVCPIGHRT